MQNAEFLDRVDEQNLTDIYIFLQNTKQDDLTYGEMNEKLTKLMLTINAIRKMKEVKDV